MRGDLVGRGLAMPKSDGQSNPATLMPLLSGNTCSPPRSLAGGTGKMARKFRTFCPPPVSGEDFLTMSAPTTRVDFGDRQTTERLGRKEPNMLIIGCDYHPGFQQIAFVDTITGECGERRLRASRVLKQCAPCKNSTKIFAHSPVQP